MPRSTPVPALAAPAARVHDSLVLEPRDVRFDWDRLPLHWIPDEPMATHVINVLHLLLPEGERWFVKVFKEALPLIRGDQLREEVLGFIGQEAIHAEAHQEVLDHLLGQGLDPRPYVRQVAWLFRRVLGDKPGLGPRGGARTSSSGSPSSRRSSTSRPSSATGRSTPRAWTAPRPTRRCSTCCAGTAPRRSNTAASPST